MLDGKAPTFTIEPHKGGMEIAAIDYSKEMAKRRGKMPKKRAKKK